MKKILIILSLWLFSSTCFANIIIQQDYDGVGMILNYGYNCFDVKKPNNSNIDFAGIAGLTATVAWEFNSSNLETPYHFYAGANAGLCLLGLPLSFTGGFTYKLKDIGSVVLELCPEIKTGVCFGLFGECKMFNEISLNLFCSSTARKGFYGGIGLTHINIPELGIYKGYGIVFDDLTYTGLRFILGYRF